MAILDEVKNHVDAIMNLLEEEDCDENISIHVNRGMSVLRLRINNEDYMHSKKGEWKKL